MYNMLPQKEGGSGPFEVNAKIMRLVVGSFPYIRGLNKDAYQLYTCTAAGVNILIVAKN